MRAEVLTPDRLNTIAFGGLATVALAIAIVGVAGVLTFSVSTRTRVRLGLRLLTSSWQPPTLLLHAHCLRLSLCLLVPPRQSVCSDRWGLEPLDKGHRDYYSCVVG